MVRTMAVHARRHPHVGRTLQKHTSQPALRATKYTPEILLMSRNRSSKCPAQQRRSDREARPHRGQHDQASLLQLALFHGGVHGEWDRTRRGVAVTLDIHDDSIRPKSKPIRSGIDNAQVGLMWNKCVNISSLYPVP